MNLFQDREWAMISNDYQLTISWSTISWQDENLLTSYQSADKRKISWQADKLTSWQANKLKTQYYQKVLDTVSHLVVNFFIKLSYFSLLPIGDGNFAVVRKCRSRKTKADFALKIIDKSKCQGTFHKWLLPKCPNFHLKEL